MKNLYGNVKTLYRKVKKLYGKKTNLYGKVKNLYGKVKESIWKSARIYMVNRILSIGCLTSTVF